jgi:hypothetical protein
VLLRPLDLVPNAVESIGHRNAEATPAALADEARYR